MGWLTDNLRGTQGVLKLLLEEMLDAQELFSAEWLRAGSALLSWSLVVVLSCLSYVTSLSPSSFICETKTKDI